ncbi:protein translocase subunit SecD [candidate division WS5 bacterium]|uniref:Protein translocase subunit SecD n=1 Tax=candidate division WS5 bacterium TaxID=2093353 RepID=A0A419DFC4_9BACT|nr:MAG: protein translocase subunit SecD [candidate division WS5 bacterium]
MKKRKNWIRVVFILALLLGALLVVWPGKGLHLVFKPLKIDWKAPDFKIKEGLDLQGGTHIVYSADLAGLSDDKKGEAMESLRKVIENRINAFGVAEPVIQTSKLGSEDRLTVELPGIQNVQEAMDLIGKTAELEFKETGADPSGMPQGFGLTGKDLKKASQTFDQNTNQPNVSLEFNDEGAKKFEEATARNVGKPIYIFLDGQVISAPNVNEKISGGKAVITGQFDVKEAKNLAIQLNAGALPVSIKVIEQRTIGATLGQEAIKKSVFAGAIGIVLVIIFMALYYRLPGIVADIALLLYTIFVLAIFKIFGVTLTLAGVAAFILSVGMAVDANVLIFERMKEELRSGKSIPSALEIGFKRAWTSIRDSNLASIITAAILFSFGSGIIKGFAVVLIIGVLTSMFTAVFVTRTFMRVVVRRKIFTSQRLYLGAKKEAEK